MRKLKPEYITYSFLKEYFLSLERQNKIISATIFPNSKVVIEMYKYIRSEKFNKKLQKEILSTAKCLVFTSIEFV